MKKLLLIATGGTIASKYTSEGLCPQISSEELLSYVPTARKFCEIDTVQPYAAGYRDCVQQAVAEFRQNARPALKAYPDSLDGYDVIFVGYPNWCGTMPMAMFTFLEHFDLTGKRILPFCTNEGSGMGHSEQDLNQVCTGATVEPGLSIRGCQAAGSRDQVADWVKHLL